MAIVDFEVTPREWDELAALTTEEMTLRVSVWPDSLTIDNGDSIIIEFWAKDVVS